jgi:hypothetical protein
MLEQFGSPHGPRPRGYRGAADAVGLAGVEPATSRLSGVRSNQLSYRPAEATDGNVAASARPVQTQTQKTDGEGCKPLRTDLELDDDRTVLNGLCVLIMLLRKEVIQPHLPVRLPCYDLAPITGLTFGASLLAVGSATSGTADFRGLTGGVYKAREHIHRCMLISDY